MIKIIAYTTSVNGSAITIRDSEGENAARNIVAVGQSVQELTYAVT
ncbi:hypothetical protein LCGC14_1751630 [marine sediment metagenome]|uniref:Uncharacterized protein n=1 Tax=marine sediment metagenome TaxID=412755 RepID=A0A0F9JIS5_9ZZZZ